MINKYSENTKVFAVVVTYNRKDLLRECLTAIFKQSFPVSHILLIDNASTDGTYEMLVNEGFLNASTLDYIKMQKNVGGAGGFCEGIRIARDNEADWVWIMDDDTIPKQDALEKLLQAHEVIGAERVSFLASTVYGINNEYMNLPSINNEDSGNGYPGWYQYLADGLVSITSATFVSLLINVDAIKACGLPIPDFFIWGDDTEYTTRLSKHYGPAYFVGDSVVIHKKKNPVNMDIDKEDDKERLKMYHYRYRNSTIIGELYGEKYTKLKSLKSVLVSPKYLFHKNGKYKMYAILKGNVEALVDYRYFRKLIKTELKK